MRMRPNVLEALAITACLVASCHETSQSPRTPRTSEAEVTGQTEITSAAVPARPTMRGLFRYRADAASFEDCATGRRYPVAMEGDYLRLERQSASTRAAGPSQPEDAGLVATVVGHVEPRMRAAGEGETIAEDTLVVDRLVGTTTDTSGCTAAIEDDGKKALTSTRWVLVEIDGRPVAPDADPNAQPPSLVFVDGSARRVSGFTGCNNVSGRWSNGGSGTLSVEGLTSTRRACASEERNRTESALLAALGAARRFEVIGSTLVLYDDQGPRARFQVAEP